MAKECGRGATIAISIILLINFCIVAAVAAAEDHHENHGSSGSSIYDFLYKLPALPVATSYSLNSPRERRQTSGSSSSGAEPIKTIPDISIYSTLTETPTTATPSLLPPTALNSTQNATITVPLSKATNPAATVAGTATPADAGVPYIIKEQQLLGVNGTGQQKDMGAATPTKPAVVSEPIQPTVKNPILSTAKSGEVTFPNDDLLDTIDVSDNETLKAYENRNYTVNYTTDHHLYYNSTIFVDKEQSDAYWESFKNITRHPMLSTSHRRAMTVQLSFNFPFYGNPIRNVTVATGGFLYTGEYVHSWLAATQYIAPLMANFDTSISNDSHVRYQDNGTAFTVIWENVSLQDRQDAGKFTFSTTLHKNGDIMFNYFSVPILIESIQDEKHPVKVGLSDAYIIDKVIFFARRKTIYEYHRVNFGSDDIKNSTVIYLSALPTCLFYTDCESCATHNTTFECAWCPVLNRCSTGTERKRQDWLHKGCDRAQINQKSACPALGTKGNNASSLDAETTPETTDASIHSTSILDPNHYEKTNGEVLPAKSSVQPLNKAIMEQSKQENEKGNAGLVFGFMVPLCLVITILVWVLYAYRNPHTKSGQLLIQYRPSQWSWRRGEARYTAATIHM